MCVCVVVCTLCECECVYTDEYTYRGGEGAGPSIMVSGIPKETHACGGGVGSEQRRGVALDPYLLSRVSCDGSAVFQLYSSWSGIAFVSMVIPELGACPRSSRRRPHRALHN